MLETIEQLQNWSRRKHAEGKRIGLVPTMGALHDGHLSLVRRSTESCDSTIVSIFVNPTQFGPNEDFHRYPRPLENDLKLLDSLGIATPNLPSQGGSERLEIFVPSVGAMYPPAFDTTVLTGGVTQPFEGRMRPTHFAGVATVVLKLFLASGADVAFFGQKDFQQACVIRKMVSDLNVPIEIVVCPIIREPDGLAMSSRNRYLSDEHRKQAVVLSRSLETARRLIENEHCRDIAAVRQAIIETIRSAPDMQIDYVAIVDPTTLVEPDELTSAKTPEIVVLLAAQIGTTRLIDNAVFNLTQ